MKEIQLRRKNQQSDTEYCIAIICISFALNIQQILILDFKMLKQSRNNVINRQYDEMKSLESIQTDEQVQGGKDNETTKLMKYLLMMSIEINRKDIIVQELSSNRKVEEYTQTIKHLEMDIQLERDTSHNLKEKIYFLQQNNFRSITQEQQQKIYTLETKIRRIQEQNLQLESKIKNLKVENSMISFKHAQAQNQVATIKIEIDKVQYQYNQKLTTERNICESQKQVIEECNTEIKKLQEKQTHIIKSYQDQLRNVQTHAIQTDTLSKSQVKVTQERIILTTQEINRLREEVNYLREMINQKNTEVEKYQSRIHETNLKVESAQKSQQSAQTILINIRSELAQIKNHERSIEQELGQQRKQCTDYQNKLNKIKRSYCQLQQLYQNKQTYNLQIKNMSNLQLRITKLQNEVDILRAELRKVYRKNNKIPPIECQKCKITNTKKITRSDTRNNFENLIEKTQKLRNSNRKVDNLLTHHENILENSISIYRSTE